jgi:hypothetical protein
MSGTSPNFEDWRKLTAIEIEDIACLMQGFDPRAIADVVVRDPDDPSSPYGVSPDTSWEVRMLISAVLTHDLTSAPANIAAPTGTTKVVRTSLIPWLRTFGEYGFLADGLSSPASKHTAVAIGSTPIEAPEDDNINPLDDWKMQCQAEAYEQWFRLRATGANPSVRGISEHIARWCVQNEIRTTGNTICPSHAYLKTHVLGGKHWKPPLNMTVEAAKAHVAQVAQEKIAEQAAVAQVAH